MGENEVHVAASRGDSKMLEFLIQKYKEDGRHIPLGQSGEQTPLHTAAEAGSLDCVQLLVSHGGQISMREITGIGRLSFQQLLSPMQCQVWCGSQCSG